MKIARFTVNLIGLFLMFVAMSTTAQNESYSYITLKSCEIDISADEIFYHNDSVHYSGNVQFLYGLANVKANSIVLIKKKDGTCKLIAKPSPTKN